MRDFLTSRFLLAAAIVGVGLIPSAPAAPPASPPAEAAEDELKPQPLPPIPDDPPPHEGAMIDYPLVADPPDLILIEVLEALPGRPISGERMIRPDGTIQLGFYGDVHVRGLTPRQIKIKVIKHLRHFIPDEVLGLIEDCAPAGPPRGGEEVRPEEKTKGDEAFPNVPPDISEPGDKSAATKSSPSRLRQASHRISSRARPRPSRRLPAMTVTPASSALPVIAALRREEKPTGYGEMASVAVEDLPNAPPPPPEIDPSLPRDRIPDGADAYYVSPGDSLRVFVDVTAYNSKNYFVQGDVASPGKLPCTGNETVLDAMNYAGGLIPSADPKNIRLVRPSRGGKPARVYKIDLEAITDRGEIEKNYQIFPGDRIIVGRDAVVKSTLEMDRFLYPMQSVFYAILRQSYAIRSMMLEANGGAAAAITPEQREAMIKEWTDFWWKVASRPADDEIDEKTFREALMRAINPPGAAKPPGEKK